MTYSSSISTPGANIVVDAFIVIDGIPIAFGTRAGIAVDTTYIFVSDPALLTTVHAVDPASISIGVSEIDFDQLIAIPSGFSFAIRGSPVWDKYFERRREPKTRLNAAVSASATSATVESSDGFTVGNVAYMGAESALIDAVSAGSLGIATRQYAMLRNALPCSHGAGSLVHSSPIAFKGRMAELWFHSSGELWLERRGYIDSVARDQATRQWKISASDAMSVAEKKLGTGWADFAINSVDVVDSSDTPTVRCYAVDVEDVLPASVSTAALDSLFAKVSSDTGTAFYKVINVGGGIITLQAEAFIPLRDPSNGLIDGMQDFVDTTNQLSPQSPAFTSGKITLFYMFTGSPTDALLRVLLSNRGNGAISTTYDSLIGVTSNSSSGNLAEGEIDKIFGAALTEDMVDVAGIESVGALVSSVPGWRFMLGANGGVTLRDFLEEVAWASRCYVAIREGKITLKPIQGIVTSDGTAVSIDNRHILNTSTLDCNDDEDAAIHTVTIKCNEDPLDGNLRGSVTLRDMRYYDAYKGSSAGSITLERRGLIVGTPSASTPVPATVQTLLGRLDRIIHRRMRGMRRYMITLPFRFHVYGPGDIVSVTTDTLPDFAGDTLDGAFEIISNGAASLTEGTVTFTLADSWAVKSISPTSVVASWSGATATLETNHRYGGATTPGTSLWGVGWQVYLLDKSATPPFADQSGLLTITTVTATSVTLSGTIGFTPAAGDLLIQADYSDASGTALVGGIDQHGHVFLSDANGRLGSLDVKSDTWG